MWSPAVDPGQAAGAFDGEARRVLAGNKQSIDTPAGRSLVVDTHIAGMRAWADAVGTELEVRRAYSQPAGLVEAWLRGPFEIERPDTGKIRALIGRTVAVTGDEADKRLLASLHDLWLPPELQRQGYGRLLVEALVSLWRTLNIEEARATAVTHASRVAFVNWKWPGTKVVMSDDIDFRPPLVGDRQRSTDRVLMFPSVLNASEHAPAADSADCQRSDHR
jgi:GNAT superfamily N-acetyltransferase